MPPITLAAGSLRATVLPELGGGIADFALIGPAKYPFPLMRRAAPGETNSSSLGSFFMAPWCNRIANAMFTFNGREHRLKPNSPAAGAPAQHGDVRARPFAIVSQTADAATIRFDSRSAQKVNWPWPFALDARYTLRPDALRIELAVTNLSSEPMPAGCGHHPYFPRRLWHDADEVQIRCPVGGRFALENGVPTGPATRESLGARLAALAPPPDEHIDTVFAGFNGSTSAGEAEIRWTRSNVSLRIAASANMGHLVLYCPRADPATPSTLPWIAVEPQTQVNGALNHPEWKDAGTVVLPPGGVLETWTEFRVGMS